MVATVKPERPLSFSELLRGGDWLSSCNHSFTCPSETLKIRTKASLCMCSWFHTVLFHMIHVHTTTQQKFEPSKVNTKDIWDIEKWENIRKGHLSDWCKKDFHVSCSKSPALLSSGVHKHINQHEEVPIMYHQLVPEAHKLSTSLILRWLPSALPFPHLMSFPFFHVFLNFWRSEKLKWMK